MKPNFKTDWSKEDFTKVNKCLVAYFRGQTFTNHRKEKIIMPMTFEAIENVIGLPYTSSSSYAMYSLDCNVHLTCNEYRYENYHYSHVAMSEAGSVYLVVQDKYENEDYFQISKKLTSRWELDEFIPQLQNNGFTVLVASYKKEGSPWIHFFKDGRMGSVQQSTFEFSGFNFGSDHKPCREYGTGLSTKRETWELTIKNAFDAINEKGWGFVKVNKYSSPEEFVRLNEWAKYKILLPFEHAVPEFPIQTRKAKKELAHIKKFGYGV